ncbi:MAG: hypothetical protein M1817_006165 [Caeruleum heppii]|nr:MAG: hypothetical protein M1817_006165 [Caeruleum heppii]
MSRVKNALSLSSLLSVDSDEDGQMTDENAMPTPDSAIENAPPKKARGRAKANPVKPVKGKGASTRRISGGSTLDPAKSKPTAKAAASKRAALREQTNEQQPSDTEEVEEFDDFEESIIQRGATEGSGDELGATKITLDVPRKKGRQAKETPKVKAERPAAGRGKKAAAPPAPVEEVVTDTVRQVKHAAKAGNSRVHKPAVSSRARPTARTNTQEQELPDTHYAPPEADQTEMDIDDIDVEEPTPPPVARPSSRARSASKTRHAPPSATRRRGGSASDTERGAGAGSDPAVRRKLGEMTKKFENLDLKYRNLRDVGVKEAEANFDRIKKQADDRHEAANKLITSLKTDLARQTNLAKQSHTLQTHLDARDDSIATLQSQLQQLTASLAAAQNESKALAAKLSATRAGSIQSTQDGYDGRRVPASAQKAAHTNSAAGPASAPGNVRTVMVGSAEAAAAAQAAELKEELYRDLTGLILRGVKRGEEADVYDCIQTGRNGTLHFKLSIASTVLPGSTYADTEFVFTPLLDPRRDAELIDLLPDYLTEEITFARENAGKFYGRVLDCLTKSRG